MPYFTQGGSRGMRGHYSLILMGFCGWRRLFAIAAAVALLDRRGRVSRSKQDALCGKQLHECTLGDPNRLSGRKSGCDSFCDNFIRICADLNGRKRPCSGFSVA